MARVLTRIPKIRMPRLPQVDPDVPDVFEEMTLQEHLQELVDRIKRIVYVIIPSFILGFLLQGRIINDIKDKANALEGLDPAAPTDPLTISFKVALYVALSISLPTIVYQVVAFLAPGLTRREKRVLYIALPFVSILFIAGVAYGYFVAAPRALTFLSNWNSDSFDWQPDGNQVVSFFLTLMVGLGLAFQLPVVMFILAKIGIVSAQKMVDYRKYSYLVLVILAAVITPSTDPINMGIVALPLVILYEVGVVIARVFAKTGIRQEPKETPT